MAGNRSEELHLKGCNFFRLRLAYSLLSGRPLVIDSIRINDEDPGLKDHETRLLKLVQSISNGTKAEISRTGTRLRFVPGVLLGGDVDLDCGNTRCISYFLELLLMISPFCKRPLKAKLEGVTNAPGELSVEAIRLAWLPVYTKFVLNDENLDIKIVNRGLKPDGGGKIVLTTPIVKTLRPAQVDKPGKVCKIRGTAWVCKVSPSLAYRLITAAKSTLTGYIADVMVTVDQRKGSNAGNSPGYGITLWATTTEGVVYQGEAMSKPRDSGEPALPEDVGAEAAVQLLDQIYFGGCTDGSAQALATTFMALGEKDVSKFLLGDLNHNTVASLRHLRTFFGMVFKLEDYKQKQRIEDKKRLEAQESLPEEKKAKTEEPVGEVKKEEKDEETELRLGSVNKVLVTGIGVGFSNLNKLIL